MTTAADRLSFLRDCARLCSSIDDMEGYLTAMQARVVLLQALGYWDGKPIVRLPDAPPAPGRVLVCSGFAYRVFHGTLHRAPIEPQSGLILESYKPIPR